MPKITSVQMAGNHRYDGAWCPGCGLYAHVHGGAHRADCTRGKHLRAADLSTEVIPNVH